MRNIFSKKNKGFTLVELIVVIGIMSIIMVLVVFNSRNLNDDLALKAASSEVSLALRQAQNYGITVKQGVTNFNDPFGAVLDLTRPSEIIIYSDINNNRIYDTSGEFREKILILGGIRINKLCSVDSFNTLTCPTPSAQYMTLTYVRPNPEPIINFVNSSNASLGGSWKKVYIELVSPKGKISYVVTDSSSGQITIQSTMP